MTVLLEQAVARARKLSECEQDALAMLMLDEMKSDRKWDELIAKSPEKLAKLADKARAEHDVGVTQELNPDLL